MKNKTCGDCRFLGSAKETGVCEKRKICLYPEELPACSKFEQKIVTNGDVIRQGGNRALAEIFDDIYSGNKCKYCIHHAGSSICKLNPTSCSEYDEGYLDDDVCIDGFEAWLNAPADVCVKQNENDATQTDLCTADNTERGKKNER